MPKLAEFKPWFIEEPTSPGTHRQAVPRLSAVQMTSLAMLRFAKLSNPTVSALPLVNTATTESSSSSSSKPKLSNAFSSTQCDLQV